MTTPATTVAPKPVSVWEDFVDIFVSPAQVFARREKAGFVLPLVVLTLVLVALSFGTKSLLQPAIDAEFARQTAAAMKANPRITAAQMESFRKMGETFAVVGVLIFTPIRVMLAGIVLWAVGKFFESKQTVGAAMVVATYAFFPLIAQQVVSALMAAVMDPASITGAASVTLSLAHFLNPDTTSKMLFALAMRVDVFL
ncbi:MAG TPA: Yip1 family protein, partial [Gemmatimonadaceae bacterium]